MKKAAKFLIPMISLFSITSCQVPPVETKTEGEILAGYFNSTSYMDMDDIVSGKLEGAFGANAISEISSGISSGILSLMAKKPDTLVAWAASSLFKLIFSDNGEDKINEINKKLDQVLTMLDNIMEKQELSSLKDDINTLRNSNAYLQTYIDYTRNLNIGKQNNAPIDEATAKAEYTALNNRFKDAPTQLNTYAHLLFDPGAKSGKNIFSNIRRIISLNHFLFDYQEVQMKCFNDSVYLTPYIYACAIVYAQLNFILKTSDPTSVEYIDASAMFETTRKNAERVYEAVKENTIEMKKEGYTSFLYPNNDKYIPFCSRIRNINSDTYINNHVDNARLKDSSYWKDWAYAKEEKEDEDGTKTILYSANTETMTLISDCISALVKNGKMEDMYLSSLFESAGFDIPEYTGYKPDEGIHFFADDDLKVTSSMEDTFYQVNQSITGNRTGDVALKDSRKVVNWGIGNIDKNKTTMYGWQYQIGVLLTPDENIGYHSSVTVNQKGNIL